MTGDQAILRACAWWIRTPGGRRAAFIEARLGASSRDLFRAFDAAGGPTRLVSAAEVDGGPMPVMELAEARERRMRR